jgi:hypothetical protein
MTTFAIMRKDGRSNAQVIIDTVKDGKPGTLYGYEYLAQALSDGAPHRYTVNDVRAIVARMDQRLLKEHQRALHCVRGKGYRLALAGEHMALATVRKRRADVQFMKGLNTLRNVRWDEMDENTRQAHQGHLMISEALAANQQALDRRLREVERLIRGVSGKQ